jgi:hypothetical protein
MMTCQLPYHRLHVVLEDSWNSVSLTVIESRAVLFAMLTMATPSLLAYSHVMQLYSKVFIAKRYRVHKYLDRAHDDILICKGGTGGQFDVLFMPKDVGLLLCYLTSAIVFYIMMLVRIIAGHYTSTIVSQTQLYAIVLLVIPHDCVHAISTIQGTAFLWFWLKSLNRILHDCAQVLVVLTVTLGFGCILTEGRTFNSFEQVLLQSIILVLPYALLQCVSKPVLLVGMRLLHSSP